ncbi:TWO-COMPONENT HYBRID SENSOR AND REGULATOR [hydrothermal vent metagenome]|uniref:TWO-COMPONENT HYBRID SENSOR AND REGULATOR n=1 Tax=hydrothermal vent metagenome TaxID=652676 RepID=A0A1W1C5W3_9ZZZZ
MTNNASSLPIFEHINTDIGLKYLNQNRELYLKILDNFLKKYKDIELNTLKNKELHNIIHAIKGLASTLGMTSLERVSSQVHQQKNPSRELIEECSRVLKVIIKELNLLLPSNKSEISTILIINNEPNEIDELIEILDDDFDILLALNKYEALELFEEEKIDLVILHTELEDLCGLSVFNFLKKHTNIQEIPLIFITKKENESEIKDIYPLQNISFIYRPFQKKKLMKQIKIFSNS